MSDRDGQGDCCDGFASVAWRWEWFTVEDMAVMPYVFAGSIKRRVNHCLFCGANIRDVQISKRRIDDMRGNRRTW